MATNEHQDNVKKIAELIEGVEIAMLTTVEPNGTLRSRPMATQKVEFDGTIYFFTKAHSPKVDEVKNEQNVCISYTNLDSETYISVSGTARLSRDRQKMEELWSPVLKAWFPEGLEDPEIALLVVDANQAEYWDGPSSKIIDLAGRIKSYFTGGNYDAGDHEKLDL